MSRSRDVLGNGASRTATVGVRVPAQPDFLIVLRALAETVLLVSDLGLDEVDDVRVAVDEIASTLIEVAAIGSSIECSFEVDNGRMTVCVTAVVTIRDTIDENGFGWNVIRTITDSIDAEIGSYDPRRCGYPVTVEFGRSFGTLGR